MSKLPTSSHACSNTIVIGSQCQPGIGEVYDYFKEFLEQKAVDISSKKEELYRKCVKEKWGITELIFNDKGGFIIDWGHLVETYCSRMDGHGT